MGGFKLSARVRHKRTPRQTEPNYPRARRSKMGVQLGGPPAELPGEAPSKGRNQLINGRASERLIAATHLKRFRSRRWSGCWW